jgi:prophage regulatory protein
MPDSTLLPVRDTPEQLVRLPEVLKLVGVGRSTWLRGVREGRCPPPVRLSQRARAWKMSQIQQWIDDRPPTR